MFLSEKTKNVLIAIIAFVFAIVCGIVGFNSLLTKKVHADTIEPPTYLNIASSFGDREFEDNSTIFLADGEKLNITLGKPAEEISYDVDDSIIPFEDQSDIGNYALGFLESSFSLTINGVAQNDLSTIKTGATPFLQFVPYKYCDNAPYTYFDFTIDLSAIDDDENCYFPSGEYVLTFTDYVEYSGQDFTVTKERTFSITLYIFNTIEYFTSDLATNQNVEFLNVEHSSPSSVSYHNYYFFNYNNLKSNSISSTQNFLPQLKFDASKFIVNISKSVSGSTYSCEISNFNKTLVTLDSTTPSNFLTASYDETTNEITVNFQDIGEYVFDFTFVYKNNLNQPIYLESEEIYDIYQKDDLLTIFGYQMYYAGQVSSTTEFKAYNDDKSATLASKNADITYLIESSEESLIKTDDSSTLKEIDDANIDNSDATILEEINDKSLQPVSTNQPTIVLNTNSQLNTDKSFYYYFEDNIIPSTLTDFTKNAFTNQSFSKNGTYLLRVVYTHPTYYNIYGQLDDDKYFVQYFFFTITTNTPSVTITDSENNVLTTNDYTKNETSITLQGQSVFNRTVTMQVYKKLFTDSTYSPCFTTPINAQENDVTISVNEEAHYMVQILSGKNNSKTTYFTIDQTEISGINIIPIAKNSNNVYEKDSNSAHYVNFFTSENVVVEWNEKLSGAETYAYYKYIPFTQNTNPVQEESNKIHAFTTTQGIITTDSLTFDTTQVYNKSSYVNNLNQVTPSQVFSNQGIYIFYVYDQAGHESNFAFCIDKTEIQIMQYNPDNMEYDTVNGFNLVSRTSTIVEWGTYKLIDLNLQESTINNIADSWIKNFFTNNFKKTTTSKIQSINQNLYFAVNISPTYALRTGTNLTTVTNNSGSDTINLITKLASGEEFANEITYHYYFIDESNKFYSEISSLTASDIVENYDQDYQITTSSDASDANVFVNGATTINEYVLTSNSVALSQAGFADSYSDDVVTMPDIRTKYYFATGSTSSSKVDMLSYRIKLNINENLYVSKITMYYYPFTIDDNHNQTLSSNYIKTILYEVDENKSVVTSLLTELTDSYNQDYYACNLNVGTYQSLTKYQTLSGKYVIIREYNTPTDASTSNYDSYDFKTRESVFTVDREEIVSSPENYDNELISAVGNGIYINVLDGNSSATQFKNLYSAKNNAQTYILQTNKLPVVVYVPTTKYGTQNSLTSFTSDALLNYYLKTENNNLVRCDTTSKLERINFGVLITENFAGNTAKYQSSDYDLSVTITSSTGTKITFTNNNSGYWKSDSLTEPGNYQVTITQNSKYGKEFPNVYNTFTFSFQIVEIPPDFIFTDEDDSENAGTIDSDLNGVYYTNLDDKVKVVWTDPSNTTYYAKINYQPDTSGNTKINYYLTSAQGTNLQPVYIKYSDIKHSGNTHWFFIDISSLPSDTILNVYMEYERGTMPTTKNSDAFNKQTSVTKQLYIDRVAPTEIINILAENTVLNGENFALKTRKNVVINEKGELVNSDTVYKYNLTQTTGAYSNYAFAVKNTDENEFISLLKNRTTSKYITYGNYWYITKISKIEDYVSTNLETAISSAKTSQTTTLTPTLETNSYYEVIEVDLAGNVAIYIIYVVDANYNDVSLSYESGTTDIAPNNKLYFEDISNTQDIYARNTLSINQLNLYDYEFLQFSLDGEIYFKSSALTDNQCYQVSSLTTATTTPKSVNLLTLLNFTAQSHHTLIINDSVLGKNYTFELYVNNNDLTYNLLSSGEGITITVPSNSLVDIKHYLSSITISSYDNSLGKYVVIYDKNENFASTSTVSTSVTANKSYTFKIVNPNMAYTYSFYDNYGVTYLEYHTVGGYVLNNDQKVKDYADKVSISETVGTDTTLNEWYVGTSNVIFNYSSVDYEAYLKIYVLTKDSEYTWKEVSKTLDSPYGIPITSQATYISISSTVYCTISTSSLHATVKQLTLLAPTQNLFEENFTGGVYRFEITQVNYYDQSEDKTITTRILINNLTPIVDLKDKNDISLSSTDALYAEQITIIVPSLRTETDIYSNAEVAKYLFDCSSYVTFNETTSPLTSGAIVTASGQYKILIYKIINQNEYLISTKTFIIADSPTDFYQVWVKDSTTNELVVKEPTGKEYVNGDTICYHHYIVNDDPQIFLNETQCIHKEIVEIITNENVTTTIYKISNYDYLTSYTISPYETKIAITKIPQTTSILANFTYSLNGEEGKSFTGTSLYYPITENNQDDNSLTIKFKAYYGIPENVITATYTWQGKTYSINSNTAKTTNSMISITLTNSGEYYFSFTDVAGNKQIFRDNNELENDEYKLLFVNGVPYLIDGKAPIQNAIYNDKVEISLPNLNIRYDSGGKPSIVVYKNNQLLENVTAVNDIYTLSDEGYYTVYFKALINGVQLRNESYSFQIISSNSHLSSFNYMEYGDYEISSIYKNGENITSKIKRVYNLSETDKLTNITISLYDEKTGQGNYQLTILTNSGLYEDSESTIPEQFTFSLIIKAPITIPIYVSANEGSVTKDTIKIEFNALDLYNEVGECKVQYGDKTININQDYLNSLNSNYYCSYEITEKGTYYIQVYSSDNLLYSYRVDKKDPLNTISIIIIIAGVAVAVTLIVTVVLLRKKMKIK